jgi:prepilin peptidase CpaA
MINIDVVIFLAASILFLTAAFTDLQVRRIPNLLVLAVIALALLRMDARWDLPAAFSDIEWSGLVLVCSAVLWRMGWLGGGDVKLVFAGALLVGTSAMVDFVLLTLLLGGALGVLSFGDMWLERNYGWSSGLAYPRSGMAIRPAGTPIPQKASVPYGIAVSISGVFTLLLHSSIPAWQ